MAEKIKLSVNKVAIEDGSTNLSFVISEPSEQAFSVEVAISDQPNTFTQSLLFLPGETTKKVALPITPEVPLTTTLNVDNLDLIEIDQAEFRIEYDKERDTVEYYVDDEIVEGISTIERSAEELIPTTSFETISDTIVKVDETVLLDDSNATTTTTTTTTTTADATAPSLSSASPADDATAVAVGGNIVLNFSEAVDVESGNIVIYKSSDDSTVETIAVTSSQVTGTGTTQITINPSSDLDSSTEYYVQIAATGFDDSSGNSYAGITDKTSLSFTTADLPTLSINDVTSSDESAANATFTVTLSAISDSDVTVDYASSNDSLSFTAADIATSAIGAYDVHVADMDGDGDLDIVSASQNDSTIAWYENDGAANPSWSAADIATSADGALGVHVADMDGDGDLDIVSASLSDDTIAWYENNGAADPTWTAADIATSADGAYDVKVADMDGDGDLDIVSASRYDSTIAWYENNGAADPTWTAANIATSAAGVSELHVADMDSDGDLDIVSASSNDNTIAWYENDGAANPSWSAADIAYSADAPWGVYVGDMDNDGDLDIVSASYDDDTIAWYENDGAADPTWSAADIATSADGGEGVKLADMDGDGDLDIVSASSKDDTIAWYENDGAANPTWTAADIATSADGAREVHVADMDGDGDLDIVSASKADSTIAWYESNASDINLNKEAQAGIDYTASSGTVTISAGDTTATFTVPVLADSYPENHENVTLTLSNPSSNATISDATGTLTITDDDSISFTAADIVTNASAAYYVDLVDLDQDGDLDILSASYSDDTIAWYESDGAANPSWTKATIATSADSPHSVEAFDMDGDGDLDIVSASYKDDTIAWYENDGAANPSWSAADIATSANGAYGVHVADMDGDGDLDIVSASDVDDTIAWYENDGAADPTWTAADIATSADGARDVHVADMDGDGDLDIVSVSYNDDTIAWYENDGAADPSWSAADIATSADGAYDVHVADMDGDGDLDIVSASYNDDTIAWYENNGAGDTKASAATLALSISGFSGATSVSVPSGASGLNAIVSTAPANTTTDGTSSADYIEVRDSASSNAGSISGGSGNDIIYIKGWGGATNTSVTGDGGTDTLVINSDIYSSTSGGNKIYFNASGGSGNITYNNFNSVVVSDSTNFERKFSATATLNDTDGSESLGDITISSLPDSTSVTDSDGDAVTVSSNAFTIGSVVSGEAQIFTLTNTGPFNFTANGSVTVTESNVSATTTTTASVLIDGVVRGVEYVTSSGMSGLTNQDGLFNYQDGDDITFKVGGVVLGTATAEDVISGRTFLQDIADVERSNLSDDYLENMAIFLQSLDANYNPGDGITITEQMRINLADIELDLRQASSSEVKQVIEQVGGVYVERAEAMEHVKDMLIKYSDMKQSDFELIDTESLVTQTQNSQSDQQSSLSSIENDKISLEVLADLEDLESNEALFSDLPSKSQEYDATETSDNQVAIADSPSVINVLDSVLGTIENNLVYDF